MHFRDAARHVSTGNGMNKKGVPLLTRPLSLKTKILILRLLLHVLRLNRFPKLLHKYQLEHRYEYHR